MWVLSFQEDSLKPWAITEIIMIITIRANQDTEKENHIRFPLNCNHTKLIDR